MFFTLWHTALGMKKYDAAWHQADIAAEILEYEKAKGFWEKWSELSDIVYAYTRAQWSGHSQMSFPFPLHYLVWGSLYMFPKYTLRWLFFLTAGRLAKSTRAVREVRNPAKVSKLDAIAKRYQLDERSFRAICQKLLKYWILLK